MRSFTLLALIAGSIATISPLTSYADNQQHENNKEKHAYKTLKVALWGDEFYSADSAIKADQINQTIKSMNNHDLDFTLFAGDTKNGSSLCTDQAIGQDVIDIFNSLKVPTLYTLGDNEWTDCHRSNNGSYDPLERLSYLRTNFFSENKSQGKHPFSVQRQGELGQAYSENSRFVKSNVEFVALHVPGSNNNLVATKDQCEKKTGRKDFGRTYDTTTKTFGSDCLAATDEYKARNVQNIAWLKDSFAKARNNSNAGIVIMIQADIYFPFELSDGGYKDNFLSQLNADNGYTEFFNTLVEETHNFQGQVLLVHGDSHYFKVDKAMFNDNGTLTSNFTRVEVFGSQENSWIEMTVDPSSDNVFSFAPVVLKQ